MGWELMHHTKKLGCQFLSSVNLQRRVLKNIIIEKEITIFITVLSKYMDQDVVIINIAILMILKRRIPLTSNIFMKLKEINLNCLGMNVINGMVVMNRTLLGEEKLLKAKNLSRDLIKITHFVLCKLIEEMIVEKLSATVFHRLHSTQVIVL
jgi:hypothetical protein